MRIDVLLLVRSRAFGFNLLRFRLVDLTGCLLGRLVLPLLLVRGGGSLELREELGRVDARPEVETALCGVFGCASEPEILRVGAGI